MHRQKYSLEFREQAVRRVIDGSRPIVDVAKEINVNEGTLSNWVRLFRDSNPVEDQPLTVSERVQLKTLLGLGADDLGDRGGVVMHVSHESRSLSGLVVLP